MLYVGMDVSSKSFVVHVINQRKKVILEDEISPTKQGLRDLVKRLGKEKKLIVFEAGNQMKWIAQTLKKMETVKIHVVHPNEAKWITQSKKKTDKLDAKKLAQLARSGMLPRAVHIVEGKTRRLREFSSARFQLQSKRVALINCLRGYVKQEGYKLPEKFFSSVHWKEKLSKMKVSQTLKVIMESYMESIEALKVAESKVTEKLLEIEDPRIEKLKSIPCLGDIASRVLVGAMDDAGRFDGGKQISRYGALTPRVHQSGNEVHYGRIVHDGRREIRKVLLQCAHSINRTKQVAALPLQQFFRRIEQKRGKKKAIVALARKLLTTSYGVLKNDGFYDPKKLMAA